MLQCHNGHPTCPDCRMTQDGLGRFVVGPCVICGLPLVFRYRAKAYLAPLMVSAVQKHAYHSCYIYFSVFCNVFFFLKLPPVYVAQQPSAMAAAAAMMMYAPAGNQQWQWPPQPPQQQPQQQQLIYPSGVPPQYAQQSLMVPMHDPLGGAGMNGNGGVACAYLGHDNQEMLRG